MQVAMCFSSNRFWWWLLPEAVSRSLDWIISLKPGHLWGSFPLIHQNKHMSVALVESVLKVLVSLAMFSFKDRSKQICIYPARYVLVTKIVFGALCCSIMTFLLWTKSSVCKIFRWQGTDLMSSYYNQFFVLKFWIYLFWKEKLWSLLSGNSWIMIKIRKSGADFSPIMLV